MTKKRISSCKVKKSGKAGGYKNPNNESAEKAAGCVEEKSRVKLRKKPYVRPAEEKSGLCEKALSFKSLLSLWLASNSFKHKDATQMKYLYIIEKHILPDLGQRMTSDITSLVLNDFMSKKLNSGRLDGSGGLSAAYVRTIMFVAASALKFAGDNQLCSISEVHVQKPPAEKKELKILSLQGQRELESSLLQELDCTRLGIFITLYAGLRVGEVCALRWSDIDFDSGIIHVRTTLTRVRDEKTNGTKLLIGKPKTKTSLRDIPISSRLLEIIKQACKKACSEYVVSSSDSFVNTRTYEYRYHRALEKCGAEQINYHALRHTFATRCIEAGMDIKTLSELLGHSDISISLNTYVHSSLELKRKQIEKLTQVLSV